MPTPFPAPRLTGLLLRASPGDLGRAPTLPPAPDAAATAAVANGDAADANASKPVRFAGVGCASDPADDANGEPEAPASRLELDAAGDVSDGVGAGAEPLSAEPLLPKGEEEDGPGPALGPGLARPLVQGAAAVAIGGGLGFRLKDHLPRSGFSNRFTAKGRFERRMDALPVKLITHPQPGLFGAAAAFARRFA